MRQLISKTLAIAGLLALTPFAARAGTTTSVNNGVQIFVTTPDVAAKKPKKKPGAKNVAKAIVPEIVPDGPSETNKRFANALLADANALIGRPVRSAGASPAGFDSAGYAQYVFHEVGIAIPRTVAAQFAAGRRVAGDPLPGDLVFFQTTTYGPSHVAIYLGGGQFVNAYGLSVGVADFDSSFFRGRYLGARRFLPD